MCGSVLKRFSLLFKWIHCTTSAPWRHSKESKLFLWITQRWDKIKLWKAYCRTPALHKGYLSSLPLSFSSKSSDIFQRKVRSFFEIHLQFTMRWTKMVAHMIRIRGTFIWNAYLAWCSAWTEVARASCSWLWVGKKVRMWIGKKGTMSLLISQRSFTMKGAMTFVMLCQVQLWHCNKTQL